MLISAASPLLLLLLGGPVPGVAGSFLQRSAVSARAGDFEEYVQRHGRQYLVGSDEWDMRRALFERAATAVQRQNAKPDRSWTAALTRLADRTHAELAALRGYERSARPSSGSGSGGGVQLLDAEHRETDLAKLPEDFSWKPTLKAMADVQDQSRCGSCWAFSSTTVLRAHAELFQQDRKFSVEEIVSCTPNPQECGGAGGCKGATAELAMDYVATHGCQTNSAWEYEAKEDAKRCPAPANGGTPAGVSGRSLVQAKEQASVDSGGMSFGMRGYRKLPENQLAPVMLTLVEKGPVVVSLAAGAERCRLHGAEEKREGRDEGEQEQAPRTRLGREAIRQRAMRYMMIRQELNKASGGMHSRSQADESSSTLEVGSELDFSEDSEKSASAGYLDESDGFAVWAESQFLQPKSH